MSATVKIVTKLDWPSFRNTATAIRRALTTSNCSIHDWKSAKPGGRIICIGTAETKTIKLIRRLTPNSDLIFYATTEGICRMDTQTLRFAESIKIVAVSEFVEEMLENVGLHVAGVLHQGVDMSDTAVNRRFYSKLKNKFENRKVVLTVSANHARKGLDRLLEAYRYVEDEIPTSILILHSQPNGYYELEELIENLGIKRVWLTNTFGIATRTELNTMYKLSDIYVQPSYSEGFGLPILEAFRFNKPVIAADAPPFNEMIKHDVNGTLVPTEGVRWDNFGGELHFKLHTYSARDLGRAILESLQNSNFLRYMQSEIQSEKWKWDANKLYPEILGYFGQ